MKSRRLVSRFLMSSWTRAAFFWSAVFLGIITTAQLTLPERGTKNATPESEEIKSFYTDIFEPFFRKDKAGLTTTANSDMCPQSFAVPKPADTTRVFIVGGSVAQNLWFSCHAPAFYRALSRPGRKTEFINAAVQGYDSFRVLRVAREIMDCEPDFLVVMSGNNEFYARGITRTDVCMHAVRKLKLFSLPPPAHTKTGPGRGTTRRLCDFRRNIAAVCALARRHKVRTVLCTMPLNRRDFAPSPDFPADRDYLLASLLFWKGKYAKALDSIKRYVRKHPLSALGLFRMAQITGECGNAPRAETFFSAAIDLDYGRQTRACPAANACLRALAESDKNIILADLDRIFRNLARNGVEDAEIFSDNCHIRERFRLHIFNAIAKAVLPSAPETAWGKPFPEEPVEDMAFWFAEECVDEADLFLSDHAFSRLRIARLSAKGADLPALLDNRAEMTKGIRGIAPEKINWNTFDTCAGEALRRLKDYKNARKHLERARNAGMDEGALFLSLALLAHDSGDNNRALAYIGKAVSRSQGECRKTARICADLFKSHALD